MWILKGPEGEIHYLLSGKHIIGRKNCDIVLENDQSISRTHAVIEVTHSPVNWSKPSELPTLNISDAGSKYGTTLIIGNNQTKLEKGIKKDLEEGTVILFGVQFNKWQLCYNPLVVVVSSLSKTEKQEVRSIIGEMGGHVISDWHPQASYLTMSNIMMTVKAISALAHAKPIVTPHYWLSYKTAITSKLDLPRCEDYMPPVGETVLNEYKVSFFVNPKRKLLFNGKTFYFFSELQFKDHSCMVQAAGGMAKLVKRLRKSQFQQFVEKDAVAMQLLSMSSQTETLSQPPEAFTEVCEYLASHGKRLIPASEIGLAVLHCSVEKYCNPDFNFSSMLLQTTQPSTAGTILAPETQEKSGSGQEIIGETKVIPDSGTESEIGLSQSAGRNSDALRSKGVKESLQDFYQERLDSNLETQGPSPSSSLVHRSKRLRVIDESDDEMEILSPRKRPTGLSNSKQKNPIEITLDEDCIESVTPVSNNDCNFKVSRLKSSNVFCREENPDELFEEFKISQLKSRMSSLQQKVCSDAEPDHLFEEFQEGLKSVPQKFDKHSEFHEALESPLMSSCKMPSTSKRKIPPDNESEPPEKRFANLDLSRQCDETDGSTKENEFMSTTPIKVQDRSFDEKPLINSSVIFKPLLVSKSKISISTSESSFESNEKVNYKKFRKVRPESTRVIPRIIGGKDLEPYVSYISNSSACNDEHDSEEEDDPQTWWGALEQNGGKFNRSRK